MLKDAVTRAVLYFVDVLCCTYQDRQLCKVLVSVSMGTVSFECITALCIKPSEYFSIVVGV